MGNQSSVVVDEEEQIEKAADELQPIHVPPAKMKNFKPDDAVEGQGWECLDVLQKGLCLDANIINQFYSIFCMADADGSNELTIEEFCRFMGLERSPLNDRVFAIFDFNAGGTIDFMEFTCAIWNVCTWEEEGLCQLLFNLYDEDKSGFLEVGECVALVEDAYGARRDKTSQNMLLDSLKTYAVPGVLPGEMRVYARQFANFTERFPRALQPVQLAQRVLKKRIMGDEWWETIGQMTRKQVMRSLFEYNKATFGDSGAQGATTQAMEFGRRSVNEWAEDNPPKLPKRLRGRQPDPKKHHKDVTYAAQRVQAYRELRRLQDRRIKTWTADRKRVEQQDDPLSVMLRLQSPAMMTKMKNAFETDWRDAERSMRTRRRRQSATAGAGKRVSRPKIFQRKEIGDLPPDSRPQFCPNRLPPPPVLRTLGAKLETYDGRPGTAVKLKRQPRPKSVQEMLRSHAQRYARPTTAPAGSPEMKTSTHPVDYARRIGPRKAGGEPEVQLERELKAERHVSSYAKKLPEGYRRKAPICDAPIALPDCTFVAMRASTAPAGMSRKQAAARKRREASAKTKTATTMQDRDRLGEKVTELNAEFQRNSHSGRRELKLDPKGVAEGFKGQYHGMNHKSISKEYRERALKEEQRRKRRAARRAKR